MATIHAGEGTGHDLDTIIAPNRGSCPNSEVRKRVRLIVVRTSE
jgi:hypothetical protein